MKVVIIGGMAAGPKAAARLRRLMPDAEITMIEQGNVISFGACGIPAYLGNMVPQFNSLAATSYGVARDNEFFNTRKNIAVLTGTKAVSIDRVNKQVSVLRISDQTQHELNYDYLVLAVGAEAVFPKIPGSDLPGVFTVHKPEDALMLQDYLKSRQVKHVTVVGAGIIGLEVADALISRRLSVALCESEKQVLPKVLDLDIARLAAAQMRKRKVDLQLECLVKAVGSNESGQINRVITSRGDIATDMVIFAVGVQPRIELAQAAGLEIGVTGAIKVDGHLRSSDSCIFAAGDCAAQYHVLSNQEVYIPLASTANKQGRVVANNIAGIDTEFKAVMGATVLQAFDLNIGRTGLTRIEAERLGMQVITAIVAGHDAPHYYPLHGSVTIKLLANKENGRLIGAQVCGQGEAIKRLDVLSTAMKFGATLNDIANLDLGYAPPYAEAIDVAIHAANTLENKRQGIARGLSPADLEQMLRAGDPICLLDIREADEIKARPLNQANVLTIPAGELRTRYHEIPSNQVVVVVCGLGIRSYDAVCFLRSVGLQEAVYLEGGLAVWV